MQIEQQEQAKEKGKKWIEAMDFIKRNNLETSL